MQSLLIEMLHLINLVLLILCTMDVHLNHCHITADNFLFKKGAHLTTDLFWYGSINLRVHPSQIKYYN